MPKPTFISKALVSLTLMGAAIGPAHAETPLTREAAGAPFTTRLNTPSCDGFMTNMIKGELYLGQRTIALGTALSDLAHGNPKTIYDEINRDSKDLGTAAASLSKYSPSALGGVLADLLPDGKFTDFVKKGTQIQDNLRTETARNLGESVNPFATPQALFKDGKEIGSDFYNGLKNVHDPKSLAGEWWKFSRKWSGAGALTYVFTEKDPIVGLQKALRAIHRQVEVAVDLGAGPEGRVAGAVFGAVMQETDKLIDQMDDPQQKKTAMVMAALFATSYHAALNDPALMKSQRASRHPMYMAKPQMVDTKWVGDDFHSDGKYDWGLVHPNIEDKPGCISLGDYVYPHHGAPTELPVICEVEDGRNDWWARPIDYDRVWASSCSGQTHDIGIWEPVCPDGFIGVGDVANGSTSQKPLPNAIACLKNDLSLVSMATGITAGLEFVADDVDSGSKFNGTAYRRNFLGMSLMMMVPVSKESNDKAYLQTLIMPTESPGINPGPTEANCVNFYSEPEFKGWTHQVCGLSTKAQPVRWALNGINAQLRPHNTSSFQCGDEVASVRLFAHDGHTGPKSTVIPCGLGGHLDSFNNVAVSSELLATYDAPYLDHTILSPQGKRDVIARKLAAQQHIEDIRVRNADMLSGCINEFDGDACFEAAQNFENGQGGVVKDFDHAMDLYRLGCEGGVDESCTTFYDKSVYACSIQSGADCANVGRLLQYGNSVLDQDILKAKEYFKKSCSFHNADGCKKLAELWINENGDPQLETNPAVALGLNVLACEYGDSWGCVGAADTYRADLVDPGYADNAPAFYRKGCDLGNLEACNALAN